MVLGSAGPSSRGFINGTWECREQQPRFLFVAGNGGLSSQGFYRPIMKFTLKSAICRNIIFTRVNAGEAQRSEATGDVSGRAGIKT